MIDAFIDFAQSLFPSISPYVKEQTKEALKQFERDNKRIDLFDQKPFDFLSQGDILEGIPFLSLDENGEVQAYTGKGMIISNTCSCEHDDNIIIAPMIKLDDLSVEKSSIRKNLNYRLFYLPANDYDEYVVDFSLMNTHNKQVINNMINAGKINREKSLNVFGFYLLLTKLTICFMRPEDKDVQYERRTDFEKRHVLKESFVDFNYGTVS